MTTSALQLSTSTGAFISAPTGHNTNTITVRLDRTNFLLWKMQVVPNISGQGWYGFLDGSCKAPPATVTEGEGANAVTKANPDYALWFYTDQRVLSILVGSMTEEILGRTTASSVWACLVSMFSAQNRAGVRQMRRQLSTLKKNDLTAAAYFHKMKGFADAMAQVGSPISDDELINYIVVGLGSQYESLQHSLTVLAAAGADTLSLADFYSMLLSCESLKEQNALAPKFSTFANAVARQGDGHGGGRPFADTHNGGHSGGRPTGPQGGGQYNGGQQQQAPRGNRSNQGAVVVATAGAARATAVAGATTASAIAPAVKSVSTGGMRLFSAKIASTKRSSTRTTMLAILLPTSLALASLGSSTPAPPTTSPMTWAG